MVWTLTHCDVFMTEQGIFSVSTQSELVMDQAIAWHLRLEEAGAEAWHDFVAWLEADPAHADAYDRLALDDAELEAPAVSDAPVRVAAPVAGRRVWPQRIIWGGSLAAAAAAAWLAVMPGAMPLDSRYTIETAPGAHRTVTLADGTKVALNGGTRVTLDRADPRVATLERGEVMLDVVHHADRPFQLRSGGVTLQDVGTQFDVVRSAEHLRVAVAEGSVLYQPAGAAVPLTQGMKLAVRDGDDRVAVGHVDSQTVGGWQQGQLDFRDTPLGQVAEDVARSTGTPIRVAEGMMARSFTGTLRVDRAAADVVRSLAGLAGGSSRRDGPGYVIEPISTSAR